MSFLSKLFGKKEEEQKVGGMEDFMTLIRVYFQAVMAADLHITNLAALPDLRAAQIYDRVQTRREPCPVIADGFRDAPVIVE